MASCWIPISYTTPKEGFQDAMNHQIWMTPDDQDTIVYLNNTIDPDQPLIANVQQTGFYRYIFANPFLNSFDITAC